MCLLRHTATVEYYFHRRLRYWIYGPEGHSNSKFLSELESEGISQKLYVHNIRDAMIQIEVLHMWLVALSEFGLYSE
jgi:hypothetical protein